MMLLLNRKRLNFTRLLLVGSKMIASILVVLCSFGCAPRGCPPLSREVARASEDLRIPLPSVQKPIDCEVRSRGFFVNYLSQSLRTKRALVEREGKILSLLRVIPDQSRYFDLLADLYGDRVGGFYDPENKKLYLSSDSRAEDMIRIARHEVIHALQDRSISLAQFLDDSYSHDELLARSALAEGQAVVVSQRWENAPICKLRTPTKLTLRIAQLKGSLPTDDSLTLRLLLDFPYTFGAALVCAQSNGGEQRADYTLQNPPRSSGEILRQVFGDFPQGIVCSTRKDLSRKDPTDIDELGAYFLVALLAKTAPVQDLLLLAQQTCEDRLVFSDGELRWEIVTNSSDVAQALAKSLQDYFQQTSSTDQVEVSVEHAIVKLWISSAQK